jgi:hypothetical protein
MRVEWRRLKSNPSDYGRVSVRFRFPDGVQRRISIHKIVLETFVGPCPDGMECCHHNDRAADNRLDNIRWGTHQSNMDDRGRNGLTARGERNGQAKLTESQVKEIKALLSDGIPQARIASMFNVSAALIGYIANGTNWVHVT